jgi:hypothetical protein
MAKSIDEKITEMKQKMKELRLQKKLATKVKPPKAEKPELGKDSPGIAAVINQIDAAAEHNKVKVAEVIKLVSRLKRTGLKIEDRARRSTKAE